MRKPTERRTSYWAGVTCVITVLLALIVQASEIVEGVNVIMPAWPLMAIFLWSGLRPHFMPPIAIFAIGLLQDLLADSPMGIWALSYLISIAIFRFRGEDGMPRDLPPILLRFAGALAVSHLIAFAVGSLAAGQLTDGRSLMIKAIATILMFPLVAFLAMRRRRGSRSGFIGG